MGGTVAFSTSLAHRIKDIPPPETPLLLRIKIGQIRHVLPEIWTIDPGIGQERLGLPPKSLRKVKELKSDVKRDRSASHHQAQELVEEADLTKTRILSSSV